ncbi:cell division protein ZapE [Arthrobacter sp. NPDC089319]|uniref:cell division protein ZapE n=1 Tax=Arthrobacter sp. NPDC089319 TaxID=3155915 RepID=UPI00341B564A
MDAGNTAAGRPGKARTRQRLLDHFEHAASTAGFRLDGDQQEAARLLADTGARLTASALPLPGKRRGLYLWGPVGRGKSWLAQRFFDAVDLPDKKRWHFHDLFRQLHAHRRDAQDPASRPPGASAVDMAIDVLLQDCTLLVVDEFHVHDPGDGQLLARLLREVHRRGITLVATSNYPPEQLMPSEDFHALFEPTIALIRRTMHIASIAGPMDYRMLRLGQSRGQDDDGGDRLGRFSDGAMVLAPGGPNDPRVADAGLEWPSEAEAQELRPGSQPIPVLRCTADEVWFDFQDLCEGPTAASDYLALLPHSAAWVISGVPRRDHISMNGWQRLSNIVDILYDADVPLTLISAEPLDLGPSASRSAVDVSRIASRLRTLGSVDVAG